MAAHQAPLSLGFSRQEHWSGLPFPSPMHERKSESEVTQSCLTLSDPMDCSLPGPSIHGIFQARVLEWVAIAFSREWLYFPFKNITNSPFSQIYCLVLPIFELCTFSPVTCFFFPLLSIKFWVSFIVTCCCSSPIFLTASHSIEWAHHPLSILWSAIFWVVFCLFTIIKNPAIKYVLVYFSCKSFSLMLCP